ncbi:MAG TPA: tetratricopeptide repeat protein [Burkholderiales bacterium]|jgi:regulator of sirC expression with transglutaminase-like and TPR domain
MSLERFAQEVRREDRDIDLARACLLIAQDPYPTLDVGHYIDEIERMALRLGAGIPKGMEPEERVVALNEFLFGELGYRGNTRDYSDPRNSYLNDVLERRTGIPITLSVLYMELGRRVGLAVDGVSFPGHFLVRVQLDGGVIVLDPFGGGAPQSESDLRARLKRVIPEGVADDVPVAELPLDQFLEPASKRQILMRLLRNLKTIYRDTDKPERQLQVLNRMLAVTPEAATELRDRGQVYQRLECWQPALKDFTEYLEREPDASDVDDVRVRMMELRALCSRMS